MVKKGFTITGSADPEVALALLYVPAARRADVAALFALDARLARVVERAREPMLAAIKLAWWRERIEALDAASGVPGEPLLRALPPAVAPAALDLVAAWEAVLDGDVSEGHAARGTALFGGAARLLAPDPPDDCVAAGAAWALVDAARRGAPTLAAAREVARPARVPVALRPLGMLAMLAAADARRPTLPAQGSPARAARMAWHRLTGA